MSARFVRYSQGLLTPEQIEAALHPDLRRELDAAVREAPPAEPPMGSAPLSARSDNDAPSLRRPTITDDRADAPGEAQ